MYTGEETTLNNGTLSPCPECGAAFIEINTIGSNTKGSAKTHFIRCTKCGYSLGPYVLLQQAIKGWEKIPRSAPDTDKGTEEAAGDLDKHEETGTDMNKPVEKEWTKAHRKSPDKISMVMLPIDQLRNHPKNVRKVYADIDDLADSIRTRGVMQNLTVVPAPGHEDDLDLFYVVIGNRRLQAAQKAGLAKLPCSIAFNMPEREQISIMVTENMQRSDLSLIEQAEGFQLMLDLGETVQTIHEKTGLSETTVRHRLKLSELGVDQIRKRQAREEKESERYYQLTIKDYEYLEKIKSVKQRRDILDKAENSSNLRWRVDAELKAQQQEEELKKFGKAMLKLGIVRDDKKGSWNSGYEQIKSYRIEAGLPDSVGLPKKYQGKEKKMYWCNSYGTVYVMAPVKKEKKTKTAADLAREDLEKRKKKIRDAMNAMSEEAADFVRDICADKFGKPEQPDVLIGALWNLLTRRMGYSYGTKCDIRAVTAVLNKRNNMYGVEDKDCAEAAGLPVWKQMFLLNAYRYDGNTLDRMVNYHGEYLEEDAAVVRDYIDLLAKFGFTFSEKEYYDILNGKSELYTKKKAEGQT